MVQREQLKKTPLFDAHVQNGGRMVAFSGWRMPIQYLSILGKPRQLVFQNYVGEIIRKRT